MICKDVVGLLSAYIDGELSMEERAQVSSHLSACPNCQTQLAAIKNTIAMVQGLGELEVPPDVSGALRQIAIDRPAKIKLAKQRSLASYLRYLIPIAAVAAIALVSIWPQVNPSLTSKQNEVKSGGSRKPAAKSALPKYKALTQEEDIKEQAYDQTKEKADYPGRLKAGGAATESYGANATSGYNLEDKNSDAGTLRGYASMPATESWPRVEATKNNYDSAAASRLLSKTKNETDGLYNIKYAKENRYGFVESLADQAYAKTGQSKLKDEIGKLLNQIKGLSLPVYLEKAKFNGNDCWLLIVRWGTGNDENGLNNASLYATDLSMRKIFYQTSN
ncbi:MAG: zf-HC2 domain-containing protein [Actinomycetota bacterium]